ncbi:MAG: hypothetical protein OHK0029_26010 [Armatimonadaceae bacterium]
MNDYNAQAPVQQVVDKVVENDRSIVVTTTISLDKGVFERRGGGGGGMESLPEFLPLQKSVQSGNITLTQLGRNVYLGLVKNRISAHTLRIGETLFIFVPHNNSLTSMAELVADMASHVAPTDEWDGVKSYTDVDQVAQFLEGLNKEANP